MTDGKNRGAGMVPRADTMEEISLWHDEAAAFDEAALRALRTTSPASLATIASALLTSCRALLRFSEGIANPAVDHGVFVDARAAVRAAEAAPPQADVGDAVRTAVVEALATGAPGLAPAIRDAIAAGVVMRVAARLRGTP